MVKRGKKGEVKDRGREAEGEGMKEERITIIFLKYFSEKKMSMELCEDGKQSQDWDLKGYDASKLEL